jgi:hypothetical protein
LWWHGFSDNLAVQKNTGKVLGLYVGMMMVWYTVLVFLFCRFTLYLAELLSGRRNGLVAYVSAFVFTGFCELLFLLAMLYNGFASFLPALAIPLVLSFMAADLLSDAPAVLKRRLPEFLFAALLLSAGMSFSWLLAAPVAYIIVLAVLLTVFNSSIIALLKWFFSRNPLYILAALVALFLGMMQGFVQLKYGVEGLVNWPGGSGNLNYIILTLFLAAGCVTFVLNKNSLLTKLFAASLAGALLVPGAVYVYQFYTNGTANYFSIKATYITLTLLGVFAGACLVALAERFEARAGTLTAALFAVGLIVFLPMTSNLELGTSPVLGIGTPSYLKGDRFLSKTTARQVAQLVLDHKLKDDNMLMLKHQRYAEDITVTHFGDMLSRRPMRHCESERLGDVTSGWKLQKGMFLDCIKGRGDFYIIASSVNYQELKQQYKGHPQVHIILSN